MSAKSKSSKSKAKGTAKSCSTRSFKSDVSAAAFANGFRAALPKAQRKKISRVGKKVRICK